MTVLATILGGGVGSVVDAAGKALDELVTSDEERGQIEIEKVKLRLMPVLAAWEERKAQAQHGSIFVAGARPSLMWVGTAGVAYSWLIQPLLAWASVAAGAEPPPVLPDAAQDNLLWLTVGLYGLRGAEGALGAKRHAIVKP